MPRDLICGCACRRAGTSVEAAARTKAAAVLSRGTVYATLTVERHGKAPVVRVNEDVLDAVLGAIKGLAGRVDAERPRLDGILAIKGVVEVVEAEEDEDERRAVEAAVVAALQRRSPTLPRCAGMRATRSPVSSRRGSARSRR